MLFTSTARTRIQVCALQVSTFECLHHSCIIFLLWHFFFYLKIRGITGTSVVKENKLASVPLLLCKNVGLLGAVTVKFSFLLLQFLCTQSEDKTYCCVQVIAKAHFLANQKSPLTNRNLRDQFVHTGDSVFHCKISHNCQSINLPSLPALITILQQ